MFNVLGHQPPSLPDIKDLKKWINMVRHILHHTTDLTCFSDISTVDLQSKQCCVEQYCTDGWLFNMCSSSLYKSWCTLPIHYPNHDIMYRTNRQTNKTFLMNICLLVSQLFAGWRMFSFNCDFIKMLCSMLLKCKASMFAPI